MAKKKVADPLVAGFFQGLAGPLRESGDRAELPRSVWGPGSALTEGGLKWQASARYSRMASS